MCLVPILMLAEAVHSLRPGSDRTNLSHTRELGLTYSWMNAMCTYDQEDSGDIAKRMK
jgi:hypothetical protein